MSEIGGLLCPLLQVWEATQGKITILASPLQETAKHIRGIRQWVTNEYAHSGIRDDGARIFEQLLAMARGSIPLC